MRLRLERLVKRHNGPATLQAVASHLHLVHGMRVENVEADGGTVGSLGCPHVEVAMLSSGFEEEGVVAVGEVTELVEKGELVLRVEFGICNDSVAKDGSALPTNARYESEGESTHPFWSVAEGRTSRPSNDAVAG